MNAHVMSITELARPYGLMRHNNGADTIARTLTLICETGDALIVHDPKRPVLKHTRLPKALVTYAVRGCQVEVSLPEWLAVREALI